MIRDSVPVRDLYRYESRGLSFTIILKFVAVNHVLQVYLSKMSESDPILAAFTKKTF